MDRRLLLTAALAAPVVAIAPAIASGTRASFYYAELDAIDALTARLEADPHTDAEWDHWEQWTTRVWGEIEALPSTPENARIKARAVWSIINGDLEALNEGQSTVCRMVRQMVTSSAGRA